MAKELNGVYVPGTSNLYAVLKLAGQMYNGSSFEDPLTANWGTYDLGLTESSSTGHYYADMPAGLSAGIYEYHLYVGNGTPAPTDPRFGFGVIYWDGTQDVGTQLLLSRLGSPAGASIAAVISSIKTDTGTTIPATLATIEGKVDTVDTVADAILDDTGTSGVVVAASSKSGYSISGTITTLDALNTSLSSTHGAGSWATATGFSTLTASDIRNAVGLASANLDTQLSTIDANVDSILDDTGISGVVVASGSKTGYSLASSGLDAITIETGMNARQAVSIIASAVGGVLAGAGTTTITIAAAGVPATNRITATVDSDENRTAVTLNLPA